MIQLFLRLLIISSCLTFQPTLALNNDRILKLVVDTYGFEYAGCMVDPALIDQSLMGIGDIVFNTNVLSGDADTSCSTCHLDDKHLTDGLPISVGVGGVGEGHDRMLSNGVLVPRNAFTLFGRASRDFNTFFWDGKVEAAEGRIFSPIGNGFEKGFKSPLSVAAVLPILARDEFLGRQSFFSSSEHLVAVDSAYFESKLDAMNTILTTIVNSDKGTELRAALAAAEVENITLDVVGNALASFIAKKNSECQESSWQQYLAGNPTALSDEQKNGAVLFFGKGRCAACHSGATFSDFKYHSLGVPQGGFGTHIHGQDIGRASVTYDQEDRFMFRTPPLVGVSNTGPYGHNGTFESLREVVLFHLNPVPFLAEKGWASDRDFLNYGKILGRRSSMLTHIDISSEQELADILAFLEAL